MHHLALADPQLTCSKFWDPVQARFEPCAVRLIPVLAASFALAVAAWHLAKAKALGWAPQWLLSFVPVQADPLSQKPDGLSRAAKGSLQLHLLALFSFLGLSIKVSRCFLPTPNFLHSALAFPWLIFSGIVILRRPHTVSLSLFYLASLIMAAEAVVLSHATDVSYWIGLDVSALLILTCLLLTLLSMSWRDPRLPDSHVANASSTPNYELRSPEEGFSLAQFLTVSWVNRLMKVASLRQLEQEDVWSLPFEFQHAQLHRRFQQLRGSMFVRLLQANGADIAMIIFLGILGQIALYAGPVLLQQLLRSMQDPNAPLRAPVIYAILSLVTRTFKAQLDVTDLWRSRRCYERSRGEMITSIYAKTLSRKFGGPSEEDDSNNSSNERTASRSSWMRRFFQSASAALSCSCLGHKTLAKARPKPPASLGKVLNLLRNDAYEVAQRFWEAETFVTIPVGLTFSIILVWRLLGWSCFIGVLAVLAAQSANALIARILIQWEKKRRATTDSRLEVSRQIVECIRHLRYYGWQHTWIQKVMEKRAEELAFRIITTCWNTLVAFNNTLASGLFPVAAFYAYTVLAGNQLTVDVAFPALELLGLLEANLRELPGLVTTLINASVAMSRIEDFMQEPDKPPTGAEVDLNQDPQLDKASLAWPGSDDPVLHNVSVTLSPGLNVIRGIVGAGKTALLLGLLGELDVTHGHQIQSHKMIAYCSQSPWLETMSIRDNILFAAPLDEARYNRVLEACALTQDLGTFKDGDRSQLGENGIGLSGGQRARVALARAVYSHATILMLDDPISALDYDTAAHIIRNCLTGPLMEGRTVALVTHREDLCKGLAKQILDVANGTVNSTMQSPSSSAESSSSASSSDLDLLESKNGTKVEDQVVTAAEKFIEDEHRAKGGVRARIYLEYIKAGQYRWWALLVVVVVLVRLATIAESWLLKQWGEAYHRPDSISLQSLFGDLPPPDVDVRPWLAWFFIIVIAQAIAQLLQKGVLATIVYSAGKSMFQQIIQRVCNAPFRYYDVTPVGRLLNRLTGDVGTVDGNISETFQGLAIQGIAWVSSLIVIASITPLFLAFAIGMTITFVLIFRRFLPVSQSLRRLEMVSLTPLMSNFSALLQGLTTVRAYRVQDRFQQRNIEVTDAFQRQDHFYWSVQSWMMYRFEIVASTSTFLLTVLALYTGVSSGLIAFVLTAADTLVNSTNSLCRKYGRLSLEFISVERVVEMLELEQEPPGTLSPPATWPSTSGDIVLQDVTIRYAPHLEPALENLSLTIKGGKSTAVLGRTGSGKTTLVTALLAAIVPEKGRILIDGIDIHEVDKEALRQRVTFLAQDPLLFPGDMRQNIDPLEEYDVEECERVLSRVCGRHGFTVSTYVAAGGHNLSQGQRQLVGLARAVLRRSPIIILDEATASIDMGTALEIQAILREEMSESTVITIAHRVEAVSNAEYMVRLDHGKLLRAGPVGAGEL